MAKQQCVLTQVQLENAMSVTNARPQEFRFYHNNFYHKNFVYTPSIVAKALEPVVEQKIQPTNPLQFKCRLPAALCTSKGSHKYYVTLLEGAGGSNCAWFGVSRSLVGVWW